MALRLQLERRKDLRKIAHAGQPVIYGHKRIPELAAHSRIAEMKHFLKADPVGNGLNDLSPDIFIRNAINPEMFFKCQPDRSHNGFRVCQADCDQQRRCA